MKLRWYCTGQTFACSPEHIRFGGKNPMKDVYTLQFLNDEGEWEDVPYVKERQTDSGGIL